MPGATKKELYLGKSVKDLNKLCSEVPKIKPGQGRMYVKSAEKLYTVAKENDLLGDEERAYVLYMKYFNIQQAIRKTPEFLKDKKYFSGVLSTADFTKALERSEELCSNLQQRYEEKEAIEVAKKLDKLSEETIEEDTTEIEITEKVLEPDKNGTETKDTSEPGSITVQKLYELIRDENVELLIMDTRSADQYSTSHINHRTCINVPEVPPGSTVTAIEKKLPTSSVDLWNRRADMDYIVLLDWRSTYKDAVPSTAIGGLKNAIFKWDSNTIIKSEPLVLEGGYNEWLLVYPTLTTNANITRPQFDNDSDSTPSLDSIEYDLDMDILLTPEERAKKEREEQMKRQREREAKVEELKRKEQERKTALFNNSMPAVDRTKKPSPGPNIGLNNNNSDTIDLPLKGQKGNINILKNKIHDTTKTTNLSDIKKALIEGDKTKVKTKDSNVALEQSRQLDQKTTPAPVNATPPSIPRNLKPKTDDILPPIQNNNKPDDSPRTMRRAVSNTVDKDTDVEATEQQIKLLRGQSKQKQNELNSIKAKNKVLVEESKARILKLEKEEADIEKLRQAKSKEASDVAALMREKRRIQTELKELDGEVSRRRNEELTRQSELDLLKKREEEKISLKREAERLRADRKNKEQVAAQEQESKKRLEEESLKQEELKKKEQEEAFAAEEKRQGEQRRLQQEAEEKKMSEERKKKEEIDRKEKELRDREEKLRLQQLQFEKEKKENEQIENAKLAAERERLAREKERIAKEREMAEAKAKMLASSGATMKNQMLPTGWEMRHDPTSGKKYYINHREQKTQWDFPTMPAQKAKSAATNKFTTKLKDEDDFKKATSGGFGGLHRSPSSPNIQKLIDEGDAPKVSKSQVSPMPKRKPSQTIRSSTSENIKPVSLTAAQLRSFDPAYGSVTPGLTGLKNLGNTCYMNSTIQCLSNTSPLTYYFKNGIFASHINRENVMGTKGHTAEEFAAVIAALWTGHYKYISPRNFKNTIAKYRDLFEGYKQQDSQELLVFLLDALHEDLNRVRKRVTLPEQNNDDLPDGVAAERAWKMHKKNNESIFVELFQGQYKSTVMCSTCGKKSVTFDTFMFLSLELEQSASRCTLHECLSRFSKEERMTGDCGWNCPVCKRRRDAIKKIVIWRLPQILIVVLKRFFSKGMWREKINTYVDFPVDGLDMSRHVSGPKAVEKYNLYAVSNHYGTMEGGHYTAFCKNTGNRGEHRWLKYDDNDVYTISKSDIKSPAAYFLFYCASKLDGIAKLSN